MLIQILILSSLHNPCERDHILVICQTINKANFVKTQDIAVISPYRKQVIMLREELDKVGLNRIAVNTVDGFQGQEREIVILSCVRGPNERKTIGFLRHPQRMNVALTRAKQSLIILGHVPSLEVITTYCYKREVIYSPVNVLVPLKQM